MRSLCTRLFAVALLMGVLPIAAHALTTFGPTPYLQTGDTPADFFCTICSDPLHIEDFEDNMLDAFLSIDNGSILLPNTFSGLADPVTDSVDGDDGTVDGDGNSGHSWFTGSAGVADQMLTISFANTVTSAGLVFTDGDSASTNIALEAFDMSGVSLGIINAGDLADDVFTGETAEDSFLGFRHLEGIASIQLTMDAGTGIEIDHIQWQNCQCIPEPATMGLMGFAMIGMLSIRRRR